MRTELWNGHPIRFVERDGEWWAVAAEDIERLCVFLRGYDWLRYSQPWANFCRDIEKLLLFCAHDKSMPGFLSMFILESVCGYRGREEHLYPMVVEAFEANQNFRIVKSRPRKCQCDLLLFAASHDAYCPVEVKKGSFDNRAEKQLRRYMAACNASVGFAVARTYDIPKSKDICFLPLSLLCEEFISANHKKLSMEVENSERSYQKIAGVLAKGLGISEFGGASES